MRSSLPWFNAGQEMQGDLKQLDEVEEQLKQALAAKLGEESKEACLEAAEDHQVLPRSPKGKGSEDSMESM